MKTVGVIVLLVALAPIGSRTNSDAATKRGAREFAGKDHAAAAKSFAEAERLRSTPLTRFNLGTAHAAAGDVEAASRAFDRALDDAALRADALYNRGTGSLRAGRFDQAVSDLTASLRSNPANPAAKRNLEIALLRREAQRRAAEGEKDRRQGPRDDEQQGEKPEGREPAPKPGEADPQQILRSVQQQELEELSRMRRPRGGARVGW